MSGTGELLEGATLLVALKYVAKIGGPKIADAVRKQVHRKGWARRAAREAFKPVPRPRLRQQLARWLRQPATLDDVLLAPDRPGETALRDLDRVFASASGKWAELADAERHRRLETVLGRVYDAVLSVREPGWATRISTTRLTGLAERTQEKIAEVDRGVRELRDMARSAADRGSEEDLTDRLRQLPPIDRDQLLDRWRDAREEVWAVVTALTGPDAPAAQVITEWQTEPPGWLVTASVAARLVAAELAAAYGGRRLAADLFTSAAADGAPRRQFWLARAAQLRDEMDDRRGAKETLTLAGAVTDSPDPFVRALAAVLEDDWDRARREIDAWRAENRLDALLRVALQIRVVFLSNGTGVVTRGVLDEALGVTAAALDDNWLGAVALARGRYLVLRARRGEAEHPYADLREARELALRVRDERRAWGGDSAEAAAVACGAALAADDFSTVLAIGTVGENGATEKEAAASAVREYVVIAQAAEGSTITAAAAVEGVTDPFDQAKLQALLAMKRDENPAPHWQAALDVAREDEQRAIALAGLAHAGETDLPGLDEFTARFPEVGAEIGAVSDLSRGRTGDAVATLRTLARSSSTAAITLANAYNEMGDVDGAVEVLRQAAKDFHDPQLRFEAVLRLAGAGREPEAATELDGLLAAAPPDWTGQAEAQRYAAQLALNANEYDRATDLLRAALEHDPADARTRWGLVHVLLRRVDTAAAWRVYREHPESLEPSSLPDAHAWIELHREHGGAEQTVRGCLRLMRQFPDSEELSGHALAALIGPGSVKGDLPADLLADLHSAMDGFFTRWPDSQLLHRVSAEDIERLVAQMTEMVRVTPEQLRQRRELTAQLMLGQLPLGILAAVAARSYAEVVLRRGVGALPAWHPDPAEHTTSIRTVREALDGAVAVDTTAAAVLDVLPAETRTALISAFRRLTTVDDALRDARSARDALAGRSTATWVYDEHAQTGRFVETPHEEADRLAEEAQRLVRTIEGFCRRTRPASRLDPHLDDEAFTPWVSLLDLAHAEGLPVWADDAALRTLARSAGLRAFSTPSVLHTLTERGGIAPEQHEQALRALVRARVADVPLHDTRLLEIAEDEQWAAGAAAIALARPAAWINPRQAFDILRLILQSVQVHRPQAVNDWLYLAVRGASYANPEDPQAGNALAASILASTIYLTSAQGESARVMLSATRQALADAAIDPESVGDPLPPTAHLLRNGLTKALSYATASQYVRAVFANLDDHDRQVVLQTMLR